MKTADSALQRFIHHEATAGLFLAAAAVLAVLVSNSALASYYSDVLHWPVTAGIGPLTLQKSFAHFINDGLMAVFFFLVGLEIKREVLEGNLAQRSQIVLPAIAAVGGMAAPALIYVYFNAGSPTLDGWAIPAATDIAFALGALSLAGSRVPPSLKVFLLTLATLDDLGAIVIIALFYTAGVSLLSISLGLACFLVLIAINRMGVERLAPYVLIGLLMWLCVLKSGVHATLAGVLLAFTIPLRKSNGKPLLAKLEESLHPYVTFAILPLFAFANAGVPLAGASAEQLMSPVPLGIAAGLVLGKPLGIVAAVMLCVLTRIAKLPEGSSWAQVLGLACLAGIGFTMSLFIGGLAFDASMMDQVRVGVIAGSLVSMCVGLLILRISPPKSAYSSPRASERG